MKKIIHMQQGYTDFWLFDHLDGAREDVSTGEIINRNGWEEKEKELKSLEQNGLPEFRLAGEDHLRD